MPDSYLLKDVLPDMEGEQGQKLHELIERAHQIELLTQHPGWPLYADYLTSLTINLQQAILSGHCPDIEDYRKKTGIVEGLRTAVNAPKILLAQVAREQADADLRGS